MARGYRWWDDEGRRRAVVGIQGALEEVAATLEPGEQLCALLNDVHALCRLELVRAICDTLAACLLRVALEQRRSPTS